MMNEIDEKEDQRIKLRTRERDFDDVVTRVF
jgi:hypothetical protein